MAVEKVYRCDLSGEFVDRTELLRIGVRTLDDRPDAADWVDVGPCCHSRPVSELIKHAAEMRGLAEDG